MRAHRTLFPAAALSLALLGLGCASGGGEYPSAAPELEPADHEPVQPDVSAEPPTEPVEPEQTEPEQTEPQPTESEDPVTGAYGPRTVVVEHPEEETETPPRTMAEAARNARENRTSEAEPIAVITDETLSEFATGELTVATVPAATTPPADAKSLTDLVASEDYWRARVRDARLEWRRLEEEIVELEGKVAALRNRFYAEDDGFRRESQIKPAWDRALDRLAESQDAVLVARENLQVVLEEGRREGALPGWLREGLEYEPTAEDDRWRPGIHEPGEPQVVEDDGGRR